MKVLILSLLLLSGCGYNPSCMTGCNGTNTQLIPSVMPAQNNTCTVVSSGDGATITCPDGTSSIIKNGENGIDGVNGIKGDNGDIGSQGPKGDQGIQGPMGSVGPQGVAGTNGLNGSNCTVIYTAIGATITCPDGTSVNILNGVNGEDGSSIVPVKLCTDNSAGFPEYGFQIGTSIYAVYYGYLDSHGNASDSSHGTLQAFMAKLTPGSYASTNGTGCTFSINSDGSISR